MLGKTNEDLEIELNQLEYSRYVSRAHTIFNTYFEILGGTVIGTIGIVFALLKLDFIGELNKYYVFRIIFCYISIFLVLTFISFFAWCHSRIQRGKIKKQIKDIQAYKIKKLV